MKKFFGCFLLSILATNMYAAQQIDNFDSKTQEILNQHYKKFKDLEYFSGAALSVYIPKQPIKNYYAGTVSHDQNSKKISADTLFQIGSITKSFTAAILLQLEKENKLQLNDAIKTELPNYGKWSQITITKLLNMTSGLPNYSDTPLFNVEIYNDTKRVWSAADLINFVYPNGNFSPPLKKGYFYSNTGYVLADMIIEKTTKNSFQQEITNRTIKPAELNNTFYPVPTIDKSILERQARGYNYNQYDNPVLVGEDVTDFNLSWAGAAGAILSTSEDIIKWTQALFTTNKILDDHQKHELTTLNSIDSGKPMTQTDAKHPKGFGLGVSQAFHKDMGRIWFYEGETLGFRALFLYKICNGVVISTIFNSATNAENDHAGDLMQKIYQLIITQHPELNCKDT